MAEPTPNPTPNPTPPADPTPPTPATGDEGKAIEDAVAKAKAEWEKDLEQKLMDAENEGARKAKLSAVKKSLHMPKRNLPKSDCLPRLQSTS